MPEGVVETKRLHRALDGNDGASSRTAIPPPLSPPPLSPPPRLDSRSAHRGLTRESLRDRTLECDDGGGRGWK